MTIKKIPCGTDGATAIINTGHGHGVMVNSAGNVTHYLTSDAANVVAGLGSIAEFLCGARKGMAERTQELAAQSQTVRLGWKNYTLIPWPTGCAVDSIPSLGKELIEAVKQLSSPAGKWSSQESDREPRSRER